MIDWTVVAVTVALIALSGFFVVIEFSLMGARRHRLEAQAADKASARAALKGMNELTTMLAAAQLGITACTFGLGAVTKPAMDYWLEPILFALGWPAWLSGAAAFGTSLFVVTFLHLVVGEMAPKSWAIAHPELAAKMIGLASRVYLWPLRPFLNWVNAIANKLVRAVGVTPVERAAIGGQDADTIRQIVEHSAEMGMLEPELKTQLSEAIRLQSITAGDIVKRTQVPSSVSTNATVEELHAESGRSGHLRVLVSNSMGQFTHVVHVRDTLTASKSDKVSSFMRPVFQVQHAEPVYAMLQRMKLLGVQLAVVNLEDGSQYVLTIKDVIKRLLPQD